ncbi:MAG: hypothetical protein LIO42_02305 [Oscillospiraceae bacterium]|nr:hypothetical protein [Oscillospiraceae bacterium]
MSEEWTEMVQAVPELRALLEGLETDVTYRVTAKWPRERVTENLIVVTEITNMQTGVCVVDSLAWQIDLWSGELDVIRELAPLVNAALCGLGLRRDYAGAEEYVSGQHGYYRKTFHFGRKVDKRTMRLID